MGGKCKSPEALARRAKFSKNWHKSNPERELGYYRASLLKKHNFTQQGFDDLLAKQEGVCPVCKRALIPTPSRSGESVTIDHDHSCCPTTYSCGKCIRGLLHGKCNAGLGCLKDNPTICRNAAEYLEHSSKVY